MIHHGTIRKYTAALLDLFNGIEIQYEDSNGTVLSRNVPIKYSSREKAKILDDYTSDQLVSGNTNVLPRANLAMSTMVKADSRIQNKNLKIAKIKTDDTFEYMYNSVPYEFTFELTFHCRGMNEAMMIVEQIAPKFNPTVNIDVWDASNLDEPTRVPVKLLDIGIDNEEYEALSSNIVMVNIGLSIMGNLYPPIKTVDRIKEFKIFLNEQQGNFATRKDIMGWDVNENGETENGTITNLDSVDTYPPEVIVINGFDVSIGDNDLSVIYKDIDNRAGELTFQWDVLQGDATIIGDTANAVLTVTDYTVVEVQCTITDIYNNYGSLSKLFYVYDANAELPTDLNSDIDDTAVDLQLGSTEQDLDFPPENAELQGDLLTGQGFLDLETESVEQADLIYPLDQMDVDDLIQNDDVYDLNTDGEEPLDLND